LGHAVTADWSGLVDPKHPVLVAVKRHRLAPSRRPIAEAAFLEKVSPDAQLSRHYKVPIQHLAQLSGNQKNWIEAKRINRRANFVSIYSIH